MLVVAPVVSGSLFLLHRMPVIEHLSSGKKSSACPHGKYAGLVGQYKLNIAEIMISSIFPSVCLPPVRSLILL